MHSLSRSVDVDASLARLEERARNVQINDESLCDSCHARLGTKLFAMYPDDSIVCYKVGISIFGEISSGLIYVYFYNCIVCFLLFRWVYLGKTYCSGTSTPFWQKYYL